jgi:hypothetical protein
MAAIPSALWKKYFEEQEESGLLAPEFCKLKNINYKTFANKRRMNKKGLLDLNDKQKNILISDLTITKDKKSSPFVKLVPDSKKQNLYSEKVPEKLNYPQPLKMKLQNGIEIEFGINELSSVIEAVGGFK